MKQRELLKASSTILKKAKEFGASLAGFASVEELKKAPSFTFAPQMPGAGEGIGTRKNDLGLKPGEAAWPDNAKTVLVIAVEHPDDKPEMDWWFGRSDPPGNKILADVIRKLCTWIADTYNIGVFHMPYHVEKGGTYLKDASVLAGLGCIGKNNILVTPEYGPRVRLRAMTMDVNFPSTGPTRFDPCSTCDEWCRKGCPQNSFENKLYDSKDYGQDMLPGRDGRFSRPQCNIQMEKNNVDAKEEVVKESDKPVKLIKYCRNCESACPIGKT